MKSNYLKYLWKMYEDWRHPVYCKKCGTCGEIGCCGIETFLRNHVVGKTNCLYEDSMVEEIRYAFKQLEKN